MTALGRRLNIAHVTSYQIPGYGYEEIMLGAAQKSLGHTVQIVTGNYLHPEGPYAALSRRFPTRQVAPRIEEVHGVIVMRLPAVEIQRRVWIRGLERTLERLRPDIIHCHNLLQFHPLRICLLKLRRQFPFALVVDDHMHSSVIRRSVAGRLFYTLYRRSVQPLVATQVDQFAAISEDTRDYLIHNCGVRNPIAIMPLGADDRVFRPDPERRRDVREEMAIDPAAVVYLYTGKIIEDKGVHLLVAAALELSKSGTNFRVMLVGDSDASYSDRLQEEIRSARMEAHFHFLPSMPHDGLSGIYAAADAAIWPRQESMAVFEAMASGLPVILSDASGYASTIAGASRAFEAEDVGSLVREMKALADPLVRQELGTSGRRLIERKYSWKRRAIEYTHVYVRALEHGDS